MVNKHDALVLLGKNFQKVSDSIVEAFKAAQLDPTQAAKIKDLAKRLQAIRDNATARSPMPDPTDFDRTYRIRLETNDGQGWTEENNRETLIVCADTVIRNKKMIGHCKDCKHWLLEGPDPLPHEYPRYRRRWECSNENFIYSWMPKDTPSNGLLYGEGGDGSAFFRTGPDFGCIHWEAKE